LTISLLPMLAALGLACGCGGAASPAASALAPGAAAPTDIQTACDLAAHRCSKCHPVERLLLAQVSRPEHWVRYVDRMRRQPESSISDDEGAIITRCLVFRSFGLAGLRSLEEGSR
jgi:hypothetical protein